MKGVSLLIAALMLFAVSATAGDISFGAKAGVAFANQDFDYSNNLDLDSKYRMGVQAGLFVQLPLTPNFALQPSVQYVPGGLKEEYLEVTEAGDTTGTRTIKPRIDYLSIPILVKGSIPLEGFSPYLIAGPRVNFQVGIDSAMFGDIYSHLRKVTFGVTLGGGGEFQISPKASVMVEFSYNPDFTNILKTDELPPDATLESVKNRTFSILAGVRFR